MDMLNHSIHSAITGPLYTASLQELIIEIGIGEQVLQQNCKTFGCLATNSLLEDTWQLLDEHRIEIQPDIIAPLQRHEDKYLITEFSRHGAIKQMMKQLNQCRLYAQAMTLADDCM